MGVKGNALENLRISGGNGGDLELDKERESPVALLVKLGELYLDDADAETGSSPSCNRL